MSPNYLAVVRGIRELHRLAIEGADESPEADAVRDAIDGPWEGLTDAERERIGGLSEDLYSLGETEDREPRPMNSQAQAKLSEAAAADRAGRWDRALELLRRWKEYVLPSRLSFVRGSIWQEAGDPGAAYLFYEHAAALDPQNEHYLAISLFMLNKIDHPAALVRASAILAQDEAHPAVVVARAAGIAIESMRAATEAEATSKYRSLIPILERTAARIAANGSEDDVSSNIMIYGFLGTCHEFLGDTQSAIGAYSRGLEIDPYDDVLLLARGILMYGLSPRAIADLELAAQSSSPLIWPYFILAHHHLQAERFADCLTMCERASGRSASDAVLSELFEWMAIAQAELGFAAEMVKATFEKSIRLDPSNDRSLRNLRAFESATRPMLPPHWETRAVAAVRTSGQSAHRLERWAA